MNPNLRFEIIACAFYKMTGYTAPGKSISPEAYSGGEWEKERDKAWCEWKEKHVDIINALILGVEAFIIQ